MKKLLFLLLFPIFAFGQTINISVDYAGLIEEPVQGETTPVTDLEIGDEFYIDITVSNTDNSTYKVTYGDIWFTFKNDAFEYLGVINPLDGSNNWYTYQWPSTYIFHNSTTADVDDLYGQYYTDHYWEYVDDAASPHAPMHIRTQTAGVELEGTVARLKFKYKQVANGFNFSESVFLRKAWIRDNARGYTFTDIKAFPNQTFDNVPPSTTVTAQFKVLFPETLDAKLFDGGLYTPDPTQENSWIQPQGALYENLSSTGTLNITQGFNRTDDFSVVVNWDGYVVSQEEGVEDYVIPFKELYDEIVTVSDVVLAFKELANRGINMDESGNEFGAGIQFMNADVNGDGSFDDQDTYLMLAHVLDSDNSNLLGTEQYMVMASKFYPKAQWDTITKANYSGIPNGTTLMNDLDNKDNSKLQFSFESAITWRGDVNLSHSTTPPAAEAATTSRIQAARFAPNPNLVTVSSGLVTELIDGKIYATVTLDPGAQEVVGTQYKLAFDNSKVEFQSINFETANTSTNFASSKVDYIKFGSLIQSGDETLTEATKYTLIFTPKVQLSNTLGLIVISNTDAVNKEGLQLNLEIN